MKLIFLCLLFATVCSGEDRNNYPPTPEAVVQKFCQLDAKGKRLSSDTMKDITDLVTWPENGGEVMVVINSFTVGKATVKGSKVTVPVDYINIGSTDTIEFSSPSRNWVNPYTYHLVKKNGMWKIDAPISAPHVHWRTAIAHLRTLQRHEPPRNAALEAIILKIDKARKQLHKK